MVETPYHDIDRLVDILGGMPRRAKIRPDEPGRERVLEAALDLFGERGYDATSIAEIGERAGIAKSVLYHYFDSKAKLYEDVLAEQMRTLVERVRAALPADPDAPRLRTGVDAYLGFLAERPAAWRLLLREQPSDPALAGVHEHLDRERAATLAQLMATPAKRFAATRHVELVGVGLRAFASWWYDHRDVPREAIVDAVADFAAVSQAAASLRSGRP
jgi:AcrR family transcriptional regulator